MTTSITIRPLGKTTIIACTTSASTPVLITPTSPDQMNYAHFVNTGTNPVAIKIATASTNALYPVNGTPADYILNHDSDVVLTCPSAPFYVSAITGTSTSTLFVTPVAAQ